jgi:hypothetical protein
MQKALICLTILLGLPCGRACGYVDHMGGFTLGYVVQQSPVIVVVRVERSTRRSERSSSARWRN